MATITIGYNCVRRCYEAHQPRPKEASLQPTFELNNITKRYRVATAIPHESGSEDGASFASSRYQIVFDGLSLTFPNRGLVAILGPSGSGKTTLLNILGGLDTDYDGTLLLQGKDAHAFSETDWNRYRAQHIGFIFQDPHLIDYLDARENVMAGLGYIDDKQLVGTKPMCPDDALSYVGLLDIAGHLPSEMSGGQAQRVSVARALCKDPHVVLADEPTASLDAENAEQVMQLLATFAKNRLVVVAIHDEHLARAYAERLIVFDSNFKIVADEPNKPRWEEALAQCAADTNEGDTDSRTERAWSPAHLTPWLASRHMRSKKGRTLATAAVLVFSLVALALLLGLYEGTSAFMQNIAHDSLISSPLTVRGEGPVYPNASLQAGAGETGLSADSIEVSDSMQSGARTFDLTKGNPIWDFKVYLDLVDDVIWENSYDVQSVYEFELNLYTTDARPVLIASKAAFPDWDDLVHRFGVRLASNISDALPPRDQLAGEVLYNEHTGESPYEVLAGRLPDNAQEAVIITDASGGISDYFLVAAGYAGESSTLDERLLDHADETGNAQAERLYPSEISYDELMNMTYKVVATAEYYVADGDRYESHRDDEQYVSELMDSALTVRIVGVVRPQVNTIENAPYAKIGYSSQLIPAVVERANSTQIVQRQKENPGVNVFTGESFASAYDNGIAQEQVLREQVLALLDDRFSDAKRTFVSKLGLQQLKGIEAAYGRLPDGTLNISPALLDLLADANDEEFESQLKSMLPPSLDAQYTQNLEWLGAANLGTPSEIRIYAKGLEEQEVIEKEIDEFNEEADIVYDSSLNPLSYANANQSFISQIRIIVETARSSFGALVALALVLAGLAVFSATRIGVLERRREIGTLRALGSSARGVAALFSWETLSICIVSSIIASALAFALQPAANNLMWAVSERSNLVAIPAYAPLALIAASIVIGLVSGLPPILKACRQNPARVIS